MPDNKKKLYDTLIQKKLYTKSYDDFSEQFSDYDKMEKLYSNLSDKGLYTKNINEFNNQFFPDIKKKSSGKDVSNGSKISGSQSLISQNNNGLNDVIPSVDTTVPTPFSQKGGDEYLKQQLEPQLNTEFTKVIGRDDLSRRQPESKVVQPIAEAFLPNAPKDLSIPEFNPDLEGIGAPVLPSNPNIEEAQGIGGKQILDSKPEEQKGNFGSFVYNEFLDGIGSLASGAGDAGLQANKTFSNNPFMVAIDRVLSGEAVPEMPESFKPTDLISYIGKNVFGIGGNLERQNEKNIADYRENVAPEIRNFLTDNIGASIDDKTKTKYQNGTLTGAIGGLAGSVPAIAGTIATGNISPFFLQSYDGALRTLDGKDVDDETKTIYATGIGYVGAKLEKLGFDKIFPGVANGLAKSIFNKSLKEASEKTAGKVTGNILDKYIDENLKGVTQRFAKFGSKTAQAFAAEYGTGGAQEATNVGGEYLLNATTGKSVFDTEDMTKWEGFVNNVSRVNKAAVMEGIGGGIMGAGSSIISGSRKKKVATAQKQLLLLNQQLDNPDLPTKAKELLLQRKLNLEQEVESEIEQEEKEQKKLPPAKLQQMKLLAEKIDELDTVLNDTEITEDVKLVLQEEFDNTVKELEGLQNNQDSNVVESSDVSQTLALPPIQVTTNEETQIQPEQGVENIPVEEVVPEAQITPKAESLPETVNEGTTEPLLVEETNAEVGSEKPADVSTETDTVLGTENQTGDNIEVQEPRIETVTETVKQDNDYGHQDINQTNDVDELARILQTEADTNTDMSEVENAIRQYGLKVDRDSYVSFGDKNNITKTMAKTYFKKGSGGLDTAAMEINNQYFNGEEVVTPQDLVDYMNNYQDGGRGYSSRAKAARAKLFDLTGKSYNKKTAQKLIEAKAKLSEQEDLSSLIQENELTLENIDDFIPVLDFLHNTKEESNAAYNKIKQYLTENSNANTRGNTESNINDRESSQSNNTSGGTASSKRDGDTGRITANDAGGQGYEQQLNEAEKLVKEKEDTVKVLQNEYDKASKALSKNLTENQTGIFENKTQSMFDDKSSQDKIVRERKKALENAKKELANAKAKLETVKDSKNQTEFDWDAFLDQSDVAPITDFLDSLKIKQGNVPFSKVLPVIELYNAAIDIIKAAVKTGNTLRKAIKMAVEHLRDSGATEEQIKGFQEDIKGKINVDKNLQETVKQTIKNSTDTRSKTKVVIDELAAIKKQFKDFEKGYKEATEKARKEQKQALKDQDDLNKEKFEEYNKFMADQQKAYDEAGQKMRQQLLDVIKNIKDLKLFNGKQMSQNSMIGMIKTVLNAGNNPNKLNNAVDYLTKRLEVMDYDNKVADARKDINFLKRQYFPKNQKIVSYFLGIDPENVPVQDFYNYLYVIEDLKNHIKGTNGFQIGNFQYVQDMYKKLTMPTTNPIPPAPNNNIQHNVTFTKPTESIKDKILNGLKRFKDNWLNYRKGMPKHLHDLKEKMLGRISVENYKAMQEAKKLEKLLAKDKNIKIEDVDAALRGDMTALNALPQEIATSVNVMRAHIDRISQMMIDEGLVSDTQKATIEVNLGQYLNRSYELFNNKEWILDNLPEPLYNKAAQLLFDQYYPEYRQQNPNMSHPELEEVVKKRVEAKIREYFDKDNNQFFNQKNDGSKDLSIMMKRNDIPIELRELFGERKDPLYNYLSTINKMAALAESSRFLHNVRNAALGNLMWEKNDPNRPADAIAQIASEGSETMDPLNGLYMSKELAEAFKGQEERVAKWQEYYLKAIGAVKAGKTVGSIVTHIKNVESNIGFILANGHWPNGDLARAWGAISADFKGLDNKAVQEIIIPLIENGVIKQSVGVNELRQMFDPTRSSEETFQRMFGRNRTLGQKIKTKLFKAGNAVTDLYQAEDDFFKIFAYMSDIKRYSKALYGKNVDDLTDTERTDLNAYVAEMVKNTYPTFSRVPKAARIGSMYLPFFGNFVSFQAESYRVGYNIVKQAITELKSDNPALRKIGASRLTGITTYTAIKNGLILGLGQSGMGGIIGLLADDDDEKQRRQDMIRYVAPFSKHSDIIALPTKGDEFEYIDVSSYDPFGSQSSIINAAFNGQKIEDGFINSFTEFSSAFVDPEITALMIFNLARNEDVYGRSIFNPEDDTWPKALDVAKYIGKTIEPGTSSWARRIVTGGDSTGEVKALAYRTYKVNIPQQFSFKMRDYRDRLKDVEDIYKKEYYSKDSTPESRLEAYNRANEKTKDMVKEMNAEYMAGLRLGVNQSKFFEVLGDMKMPKYLTAAILTGNPDFINIKYREAVVPKSRQEKK